jgi:hypothetical protein
MAAKPVVDQALMAPDAPDPHQYVHVKSVSCLNELNSLQAVLKSCLFSFVPAISMSGLLF